MDSRKQVLSFAFRNQAGKLRRIGCLSGLRVFLMLSGLTLLILIASLGCNRDPRAQAEKHFVKAQQYIKAENIESAIIELRQAVQAYPGLANAHYDLGRLYLSKQLVRNAYSEFLLTIKYDPNHRDAWLAAADLLVRAGELPEARDRAMTASEKWPNNAYAKIILAESYFASKDYLAGRPYLDEALKLDPQNSRAVYDLALAQIHDKQYDLAKASLQRASELAPDASIPVLTLARFLESEAHPEEAEAVLQKFAERKPDNIEAQQLLGTFFVREKRYPQAETQFKRVSALGEKTPLLRSVLAQFYVSQGRVQDAEHEYKRVLAAHDDDRLNSRALASLYYANNRKNEATEILEKLLKNDPNDAESLELRGRMALQSNRPNDALLDFERAKKSNPGAPGIMLYIAKAQAAKGDVEQAKGSLRDLLSRAPKHLEALQMIGELDLQAGQADLALEDLSKAAALDPNSNKTKLLIAEARLLKGDLPTADRDLTQLLAVEKDQRRRNIIFGLLAKSKLGQKKYSEAVEVTRRQLKEDPNSASGLYMLGIASSSQAQKQANRGIQEMEAYLAKNPWADGYQELGKFALQVGNYQVADRAFHSALQLDPNLWFASAGLADTYERADQIKEARKIYDDLVKKYPDNNVLRIRLAQLYTTEGDWPHAQAVYEDALKLDPKNIYAKNDLAWGYLEHGGNLDLALKLAQEAKEAAPNNPAITDTLAWLYVKKGTNDAAIELMKDCVKRAPENSLYHYHLGVAYFQSGRMPEAKQSLQTALKKPNFKEQADAYRLLAQIK